MLTLSSPLLAIVVLVMLLAPSMLRKCSPSSSGALPRLESVLLLRVEPVTSMPLIPCCPLVVMFRRLRVTVAALSRWMAALQPVLAPTVAALPHGAPAAVAVLVKFMFVSEMFCALMKLAPRLVMFWTVPPGARSGADAGDRHFDPRPRWC